MSDLCGSEVLATIKCKRLVLRVSWPAGEPEPRLRRCQRCERPSPKPVQDQSPKCLTGSRYESKKHLLRVAQVSGVGDCNVGSGYCS